MAASSNGSSYAPSVVSSRSSASIRAKAEREHQDGQGEDLLDRRSPLENGIFGVLFTLSKENSETRIRIRWVLLKIFLDAWQLFTTVINPVKQGWSIDGSSTWWAVISVLNFTWLGKLGYGAYLAVLYAMVALLAFNVGLCVWVAWCFKEHKFPVVWPIKVLRVFSSVFFQAFDVASLNLLQLGISCNYNGPLTPHMHFTLYPAYSCAATPHIMHAVVSALCLVLFVAIALLLNMAEVEVNPASRRPLALGHSGAEVMAFGIKVLLTLVDVFIGYRTVSACVYMALALALAYQSLRWNPNLVLWVNCLKSGVSVTICWCCLTLIVLVFHPGVKTAQRDFFADLMTYTMLGGLPVAFTVGALMSRRAVNQMTKTALASLASARPDVKLEDVCDNLDDPRDVEIVTRCCRVWKDRYTLDPDAVNKAHQVVKAGLAMFPSSAYMVLLHGNFMIDVLGVVQSGSSRIEEARKLNPSLMCRFIMFVRQQQATQKAAGNNANDGGSMDLLGYVEYQRKQRMVVRLHREALQAMCNFWKSLDASRVSFMNLSRSLGRIESSVSQAQTAYRVVLESYGSNPKLVRLYGKFLQTIKNDPWRASEYFTEADRLEEVKNGDARGPLLPDGTPLGRMDEIATAVLVISANGEIQMANRHTHVLFGYKRGFLEGKPMATLLAPHLARRVTERLSTLASVSTPGQVLTSGSAPDDVSKHVEDELMVGMHYDRLAFGVKLSLRKVSGVGEDSTFIAMMEPLPPVHGLASLWVAPNGTVAACDPQFVANFGWRSPEVNGSNITAFVSISPQQDVGRNTGDEESRRTRTQVRTETTTDILNRLLKLARAASHPQGDSNAPETAGLRCLVAQKYDTAPLACVVSVLEDASAEMPVYEIRIQLLDDPGEMLVVNRKGTFMHISSELVPALKDVTRNGPTGAKFSGAAGSPGGQYAGATSGNGGSGTMLIASGTEELAGFTLADFMPAPWKEMHPKWFKDITMLSPPGRTAGCCRRPGLPGPTLELRSASGLPLYMNVSVTTLDIGGELNHVVRLARSSLRAALDERRLRLTLDASGMITAVSDGMPRQLLRLEPSQIIGRGLWEVVSEGAPGETVRVPAPGPHMLGPLLNRALTEPGLSWRVSVAPPQRAGKSGTAILDLAAAARVSMAKPAVMQVFIELPPETGDSDQPPTVYVDLWPLGSISGLLELDVAGRIRTILEDELRPVGLLFGLPTQALLGSMFNGLVELPPNKARPGDLLSLHGTKKSSLKAGKKETSIKAGPVHVLRGVHVDGEPITLDVQVVGKPGPGQPVHAILRFHIAPMLPATSGQPAGSASFARRDDGSTPVVIRKNASFAKREALSFTVGNPAVSSPSLTPPNRTMTSEAPAGGARATPLARLALSTAAAASGGQKDSDDLESLRQSKSVLVDTSGSGADPQRAAGAAADSTGSSGDKGSNQPTGYSNALDEESAVTAGPPSPPAILGELAMRGVSTPPVGKTGMMAGRSKLGDMVRSVGLTDGPAGNGGSGTGSGSGALSPHGQLAASPQRPLRGVGSGRVYGRRDPKPLAADGIRRGDTALLNTAGMAQDGLLTALPGMSGALDLLMQSVEKRKPAPPIDVESVGESEAGGSDGEARKQTGGDGRISTWVTSKGAFFQNSVATGGQSDEDRSHRSGDFSDTGGGIDMVVRVRAESVTPGGKPSGDPDRKAGGAPAPGAPRHEFGGGYVDDDAASEGGQSAMSAQSASGGAEYKRGKRFRKLIKLMDSSQAQQVQERFRIHALGTVAILAFVHIVCFALIVVAIEGQRASMLNLGHSGDSQECINQILLDVRSLDVISRNHSLPHLYTAKDAPYLIDRIAANADSVKTLLNDMLEMHHGSDSAVLSLFFYRHAAVWNGNDLNGGDLYINVTIWDFATRFFSMSREIVQHYDTFIASGMHVADSTPGQFLLKSGGQLFMYSKEIMDALLYEAADNVHWVDTLQLIFLAVEGTAISSLAALYLAYLLRAVAEQRHKLYATFLVIPLGLTRALASQNTALLVDDDEDEDDDEDDDRAAVTNAPEEEEGPLEPVKIKRRATLNVGNEGSASPMSPPTRRGSDLARSRSQASGRGQPDGPALASSQSLIDRKNSMMSEGQESRRGCGWSLGHLWRSLKRRVMPLPPPGSSPLTSGKRKLKDDSHETLIMMMPFVFWSIVVITIYAIAVIQMQGVVEIVAIHSVSNFMTARTLRTVFYGQELAVAISPADLLEKRKDLMDAYKMTRDAWYTLQLGENAYIAAGADTERFPLVKSGMAYSSPELVNMFYGTNFCHRQPVHLPCVDPSNRFYQVTHTGLDSMMQQFMMSIYAMGMNTSMVSEGLSDDHFDFVYNVGSKDLVDGIISVENAHSASILSVFKSILVLHVILFLVLWVVFAGFLILLLNPLLKRISKERRRIAELMSQLPLELDVEKLVARALGTMPNGAAAAGAPGGVQAGAGGVGPGRGFGTDAGFEAAAGAEDGKSADATSKWKAIIRSASATLGGNKPQRGGSFGSQKRA